jgi:hypothetical protein
LCITHDNYTLESLTDKNIHLQEGTILEEEYAAR